MKGSILEDILRSRSGINVPLFFTVAVETRFIRPLGAVIISVAVLTRFLSNFLQNHCFEKSILLDGFYIAIVH